MLFMPSLSIILTGDSINQCFLLTIDCFSATKSSQDLLTRPARCAALLVVTQVLTRSAQLWDAHSGELVHTLRGHQTEIVCLSFNPQVRQID